MRPDKETIDVWYSPGCDTSYSISLCDEYGDEICCIGGDDDIEEAWTMACDAAETYGVPARLMPDETGRVTRTWMPMTQLNAPQAVQRV
jgi:hypothetical protein